MAQIPFPSLLNRNKFILIIVILSWALVVGILQWLVDSRYQQFLDSQQRLSQQSLNVVANEIHQYIDHSRQLAEILVMDHQTLIRKIAGNPDNPQSFFQFNQIIKQFFPEAFNYTIADARGAPLMHLVNKFIGKGCSTDIRDFSQGKHLNEIFIHSNPNPKHYHFDVLASIDDIGNGEKGIFFVSLDTRNLQRLLKNGEPLNHQFFIIREDKQALIEMTSEGTQGTLTRDKFLQKQELKNIIATIDIEGTRWKLLDVIMPEFKQQTYYELQQDALIITVIFLLVSLAFIIITLINNKKQLTAELTIQSLNETLKNNIEHQDKELDDSQKKLSFLATHDPLTGLINRQEFEYQLEDLVDQVKAGGMEAVIMYLDLDQFKVINNTAGHHAGDELLRQIACLLQNELADQEMLARLGADEFGIILENCAIKKATGIANQLHNAVNNYVFKWSDNSYRISISIGMMPIDSRSDLTTIMADLDVSSYAAKVKARNSVSVFSANDSGFQNYRNQMFWATEAIQAIESERMELFCQSLTSYDNDKTPWYEVFARIRDRQGKLVYPDIFIPALECYGGIEQLDYVVLEQALKFLSKHKMLRFSINISGVSIANRQFHDQVLDILNDSDIDMMQIVFEITETAMIPDLTIANEFIAMVKSLGCQIALDNFGTGATSLDLLENQDIDYIKLPGDYVKNIHEQQKHHAMVTAIHSMAQIMGKQLIAGCVQDEAVATRLKDIGINYGQGYLYHRPAPLTDDTLSNHTDS